MSSRVQEIQSSSQVFVPDNYFRSWQKEEIFGDSQPLEIDLGCGDGSFLIEMAKHFPERNFLGVERLMGRVEKVMKKIKRANLTNVKVLRLESLYTVEWLLSQGTVSRLHLLCPDPWPKEKHHHRRLVQQPFLHAVWKLLEDKGEFLFKTDHPEYFSWAANEVNLLQKFSQVTWQDDDFYYPKTDFQIQWEAEGKKLQGLRCVKHVMTELAEAS